MLGCFPPLKPRSWEGKARPALEPPLATAEPEARAVAPGTRGSSPAVSPLLCHRCCVPAPAPRSHRGSCESAEKPQARHRQSPCRDEGGEEIKSGVTFHSQSREQPRAPALGSAPAPRPGGPRGFPATSGCPRGPIPQTRSKSGHLHPHG